MKELLLSLLLSSALAGLALWKKALTSGGLLLAWVLSCVITFCGGAAAFAVLAATFVFTILAGKLSGKIGKEIGMRLHEKAGQRDAVQIVCNVSVGTVCLVLNVLTRRNGFLWAYCGAMAASLADSMASELGVLSKKQPRDILSMRPVETGISGGVTLLGLGTSLLGAVLIALLSLLLPGADGSILPDAAAAGFFAALCDSILGSAVQVKYRCPVCGALTEKPLHCGVPGTAERGLPFVTNDTVNFINNVLGALAAAGLYVLHH